MSGRKVAEDVPLEDVNLPEDFVEKLKDEGVRTALEFAYADPARVAEVTGRDEEEVRKMQRDVRREVSVRIKTLEEWAEREERRITTCSKALDELLGGGVPCGELTEFAGPFGSGKSQIAFQLSVDVQLPEDRGGLEAKAFFIDTEGTLVPRRIGEMAEALGLDPRQVMSNIYVVEARSVEEQMAAADEAYRVCERDDVGLVVVDSLTYNFRAEYKRLSDISERQTQLMEHLRQLMDIARDHGAAVVFTNQVHVDIEAAARGRGRRYEPVGGTVVAHQATHRVFLRRGKGEIRIARLEDSPYLPPGEAPFRITREGIRDVE